MEAQKGPWIASDSKARSFYKGILDRLKAADIPFLVGGAFALYRYTGISRDTKDLDLFVLPSDVHRALDLFKKAGFRTELTAHHWLGKIFNGKNELVDLVFGSGNGLCIVDKAWFDHAEKDVILQVECGLIPVEEMIWSKGFILERERFDGADIAHLIRARGRAMDWDRLLRRFGEHWPVLLSHLVLFHYSFPSELDAIPARVMRDLTGRLLIEVQQGPSQNRVCQGTLLSHIQYEYDVKEEGYADARLPPWGQLTDEATKE